MPQRTQAIQPVSLIQPRSAIAEWRPIRGERALVAITERRGRPPAPHMTGDQLSDVLSLLFGDRRETGQRLAVRPGDECGVPDDEDLGVAGHGQIGSDPDPAALAGRRAEPSHYR
jgi:hypothetical protein